VLNCCLQACVSLHVWHVGFELDSDQCMLGDLAQYCTICQTEQN